MDELGFEVIRKVKIWLNTTTALALPEPLVKPLFAESRKTQETTMQSRSTKKSAVVVLT